MVTTGAPHAGYWHGNGQQQALRVKNGLQTGRSSIKQPKHAGIAALQLPVEDGVTHRPFTIDKQALRPELLRRPAQAFAAGAGGYVLRQHATAMQAMLV